MRSLKSASEMSGYRSLVDEEKKERKSNYSGLTDTEFRRPTLEEWLEMPCANDSFGSETMERAIEMSGTRSMGVEGKTKMVSSSADKNSTANKFIHPSIEDWLEIPRMKKRYRKIRCFNCGEFAEHIAANCSVAPRPRRCHLCQSDAHFMADCPLNTMNCRSDGQKKNVNANSANGIANVNSMTRSVKNCTIKTKHHRR